MQLVRVADHVYEIPREGEMNVPARVYGSDALVAELQSEGDLTLEQIRNVATLPGIQKYAVVLPDGHQGYGFPIGGVAAVDREDGVVSPGGIGFDINCGVRLLRTNLTASDVRPRADDLADRLAREIPTGLGSGAVLDTNLADVQAILEEGMEWLLAEGYAREADLTHCEENGRLPGDPNAVPAEALKRGVNQVGSLGSGNHFLEVQLVSEIADGEIASAFGLEPNQIVVTIHSGSRGLGHQTCTEYVREFERSFPEIADSLPDRQLIYAPLSDSLAQRYLDAMNAAANFAWANRQAMTHAVRGIFAELFDAPGVDVVYDVCHNIAKTETHEVVREADGESARSPSDETELLVHRKGATRAFPAGRPEIPEAYRDVGQPVLIPGSMGTPSYVLAGGPRSLELTFGSTPHGAGRRLSRSAAKKEFSAEGLRAELDRQQVTVRARSRGTLTEEAPGAYKDIDDVIRTSEELGLGTRVAKLQPVATIKG
jgi:tRNA-splicing ligase RtcB